jgi:hypothetical protein
MSFYIPYKNTGEIVFITNLELNAQDLIAYDAVGYLISESEINTSLYYVANNQLVLKPIKPQSYYQFNYQTKTWYDPRSYEVKCELVKVKRNQLLTDSDWTQIPNNPLTLELQQEWATYRQELRDVTQQSGYPDNVIWPTPPQG